MQELFSYSMCSVQMGNTNSSNASKDGTYPLQPHALFKSLWCLQHLACSGAEVLKTAKHARSFDLWTHLPHLWFSRHSLNLLYHNPSGRLHIAHCKLNELYLFLVSARPACSGCPGAGARPWPPRPGACCRRCDVERREGVVPRPAAGEADCPFGPGRGRIGIGDTGGVVLVWLEPPTLRMLLQRQLLRLLSRVLRPQTELREGDLQQHHSFDPNVEAVVAPPRSWVRSVPCV